MIILSESLAVEFSRAGRRLALAFTAFLVLAEVVVPLTLAGLGAIIHTTAAA